MASQNVKEIATQDWEPTVPSLKEIRKQLIANQGPISGSVRLATLRIATKHKAATPPLIRLMRNLYGSGYTVWKRLRRV